jgi:hypothetical protein
VFIEFGVAPKSAQTLHLHNNESLVALGVCFRCGSRSDDDASKRHGEDAKSHCLVALDMSLLGDEVSGVEEY